MRVVLMGPPGAGKGTQAKRLAERLDMDHLSSGDIFRAEKAGGSRLGEKLAEYMDAGVLVPDEIVVEVMAKAITSSNTAGGLLLDGFPRTLPQAQALDEQLQQAGKPLDAVIVITAEDDLIVKRITGRLSCDRCGKIYHVSFMPPEKENVCDVCGAELTQRADDTEQLVRQRLKEYYQQTEPVIVYYRGHPELKIIEADGNMPAENVYADLVAALEPLQAKC